MTSHSLDNSPAKKSPANGPEGSAGGSPVGSDWNHAEILADYRVAFQSRCTDDIEEAWKKNGRIKFHILAAGQEIPQLCAARALRDGDWMRGYYRGLVECLRTGTTSVRETLAQALGNSEEGCDPASGGRMMGRHFGSRLVGEDGELVDLRAQVNRASDVSSTASQMGPSLGLAVASQVFASVPELGETYPGLSRDGREVAHVSIGDASMAEGVALESIHQAVVHKAPLVISVYDNGYGISVPSTDQVPHASVSRALRGLAPLHEEDDGLRIIGPIEGWDYRACREAYEEAFEWVRRTGNPALVHTQVSQPRGHSSSGDHRRYKSDERLQWEEDHDGLAHMREWMISEGLCSAEHLESLETEVRAEVAAEAEAAWKDYYAPIIELAKAAIEALEAAATTSSAPDFLAARIQRLRTGARLDLTQQFLGRWMIVEFLREFLVATRGSAPQGDPARAAVQELLGHIEADSTQRVGEHSYASGRHSACHAPHQPAAYDESLGTDTGAHILAAGVATLMRQDPRIVTFGEDTGSLGGVTTCSLGLQSGRKQTFEAIWNKSPALLRYMPDEGFGKARVWDMAIAEGSIVGMAAGLAVRGLRPIAEIQYQDYAIYGIQQITEELACVRHRSDGGQEAPAIVWCQGHRLLGMWHSGSPMAQFMSIPGLRILTPRNAVQTVGLYRATLLHGRDPAFVVVPLLDLYTKLDVPSNLAELCIPLGHSERLREGEDATIITYGYCCTLALNAAEQMQEHYGLSVEVVDLQTLNPLDLNGVARDSILKTGRVLILDEDSPNGAAAMIAKGLLHDAVLEDGCSLMNAVEAVEILCSPDHKPAYGEDGGYFSKPQSHHIVAKVIEMWNETRPDATIAIF